MEGFRSLRALARPSCTIHFNPLFPGQSPRVVTRSRVDLDLPHQRGFACSKGYLAAFSWKVRSFLLILGKSSFQLTRNAFRKQ
jgi:hypothetical protein